MVMEKKIEHAYVELKEVLGWTVDKRIILSLSGYYITFNKEVDKTRFKNILDIMKKRVNVFSPLRSQLQPLFASIIDVSGQDPAGEIEKLLLKVEELKKNSFKMNHHSYLAALWMSDEQEMWGYEISRAKELMSAMKVHHRFLTNSDDYPYAMFLGKLEGDIVTRAETMNKYYEELKSHKFYPGNELQAMSQILTYTNPTYDKEIVPRIIVIRDGLKSVSIKIPTSQYPILGFLAALKLNEHQLMELVDTYRALSNMKLFKWYKDSALPIAFGISLKSSREIYDTATISMATSIDMLLQAQQAMMISSIATTSITASNNSH